MSTEVDTSEVLPWHWEWLWVSGYSTLGTLIFIFNGLLIFSVIKNKYLLFSFHYAIIAIAIRNIARLMQSCYLVGLAKLTQTDWLFKMVYQLPPQTVIKDDLTTAQGMPITCQMHCTADIFLMSLIMFYIATLAVYSICRPANPDYPTYKRPPFINAEQCWIPTLVTLLPPLLSCILSLPGPWLGSYHDMAALPHTTLCRAVPDEATTTYTASVAILGYMLPLAVTIIATMAMMIRRCVACARDRCCSSYTKEELALVIISCVYTLTQLAMYLPTLDIFLAKFGLPTTRSEIGQYLTPEIARLSETIAGLVFPLVLYMVLPGYRRFLTAPDTHDIVSSLDNEEREDSEQPRHHVTRLSQDSFDMQLVARNGHLHMPDDESDEEKIYH